MIDSEFWRGRRVLLTGHTGFKGGWLALWLQSLGSRVFGVSLSPPTTPSLYEVADVGRQMADEAEVDIRDAAALEASVRGFEPEVIFHLAAQPLVRRSFVEPRETFATNVMGTVNLLEAARGVRALRSVVVVTSDKCYENRGWEWGYREDEPMGGHDPYSSSKGAAELVTAAYRSSFFSVDGGAALASARAGNVIGGGDWGADRLVPDLVRAALGGETLHIRNPTSVRPWQHVVNPLGGYLLLAQALWSSPAHAAGWNFGPPDDDACTVEWVVQRLRERWGGRPRWEPDPGPHPHEAHYLKVDSARARERLGWRPMVSLDRALESIVRWYERFETGADMRAVTLEQVRELTTATG
jgi:CDP-glucose 4,6-dehydratase